MSHPTTEYKKLKEDFVSNLTGGPISEISYVTAVAPVCHISHTLSLLFDAGTSHLQGEIYMETRQTCRD
jgi:hypothetical protein